MHRSPFAWAAAIVLCVGAGGCGGAVAGEPSRDAGSTDTDSGSPPFVSPDAVAPEPPGLPRPVALASDQVCPSGMALDETAVYWTTCGGSGGGFVRKVPKAGGQVVTLATGSPLQGIAVDALDVYWANAADGSIDKVPVQGGPTTTVVKGPLGPMQPTQLAVDDANVYWADPDYPGLLRAPKTGGVPTVLAALQGSSHYPIALDATDVFWIDSAVRKVAKTGGTGTPLSGSFPVGPIGGLAVDATNVYWTEGLNSPAVSTVPIQGGTPTVVSADTATPPAPPTPLGGPLAIDAARAYWADSAGDVLSAPLGGGESTALASDQGNVTAIAVDATTLYWLANVGATGAVMELALP